MAKKGKMRSASAVKRGGNSMQAPDAKARIGSRSCKADDLQKMITALRSQLIHVKAQTAFLALKRSEMRPDDQMSLYGFMDAQEQIKIEKSLLTGHVRMLQDMMAERKVKHPAARVSAEPAGKAGSHGASLRNPAKPKWRRRVKPDMEIRRLLNEIRNMD